MLNFKRRGPAVFDARLRVFCLVLLALWPVVSCVTVTSDSLDANSGPSSLSVSPATGVADGQQALTLTASIRDVAGTPLRGASLSLACQDANLRISAPAIADANGITTAMLRTSVAGSYDISVEARAASGASVAFPGSVTVVFFAPSAASATLALEATPAAQSVDVSSGVTLALRTDPTSVFAVGSAVTVTGLDANDTLVASGSGLDAGGQ